LRRTLILIAAVALCVWIFSASVIADGNDVASDFAEAAEAGANILLAASVFHFNIIPIPELKEFLKSRGFSVS
jgi:cyclase